MYTFIFLSWSLPGGWERCDSRGEGRKMERMRDTWEIATCFCCGSEFWISGCFWEILMRAGVNRACMQSRFLQLVDATDHRSGSYTISQLWPACTWLSRAEGLRKATGDRHYSHPMHRGYKKKLSFWLTHGTSFICFTVLFHPVIFILMPPCCHSDKTFATEAVTVHLRQIRLPHWFWMIILQHHDSHWFIFKESHYYFLLIGLSL